MQNTRVFLVYFLHEKKYFGHECGAQRRTSAQNIFSSARNTRGKLEYSARVRNPSSADNFVSHRVHTFKYTSLYTSNLRNVYCYNLIKYMYTWQRGNTQLFSCVRNLGIFLNIFICSCFTPINFFYVQLLPIVKTFLTCVRKLFLSRYLSILDVRC